MFVQRVFIMAISIIFTVLQKLVLMICKQVSSVFSILFTYMILFTSLLFVLIQTYLCLLESLRSHCVFYFPVLCSLSFFGKPNEYLSFIFCLQFGFLKIYKCISLMNPLYIFFVFWQLKECLSSIILFVIYNCSLG